MIAVCRAFPTVSRLTRITIVLVGRCFLPVTAEDTESEGGKEPRLFQILLLRSMVRSWGAILSPCVSADLPSCGSSLLWVELAPPPNPMPKS